MLEDFQSDYDRIEAVLRELVHVEEPAVLDEPGERRRLDRPAERVEVPAPPPQLRTNADVAETFLARLDGSMFDAPLRPAGELARRLEQWAGSVKGATHVPLVIQLDPPDDGVAWYLSVLAAGDGGRLGPVEGSLVTASPQRRADVRAQLARLERLFPELLRPGGRRRGEVLLSQDEAWQLMTVTGDLLVASGFDVRVPALSRKRPTPTLRLTSEDAQSTVVGARQLAHEAVGPHDEVGLQLGGAAQQVGGPTLTGEGDAPGEGRALEAEDVAQHVRTAEPGLVGPFRQRRRRRGQVGPVQLDPAAPGLHQRAGLAGEAGDLLGTQLDIVEERRPADVGELARPDHRALGVLRGEAEGRRRTLAGERRHSNVEAGGHEEIAGDGHETPRLVLAQQHLASAAPGTCRY